VTEPAPDAQQPSIRRAAILTALAGISHAVLFLIAFGLLSTVPGQHSSDAEILAYYDSPESRRVLVIGLYIMPFAAIAFLWFIVALRLWIRAVVISTRRDELSAEVQLVSGVLYLGLFLVSAAAISSTAATVELTDAPITAVEARILPSFGATLLTVLAMRMAAVFVISSTRVASRTDFMPRWMIYTGYAVGIFLLLSITLSPLLIIVFPIWMIVLCLLLLQRARSIPRSLRMPANPLSRPDQQ
jgi:hypothetical protein